MNRMQAKGGWIASFVVVGVILVLGLLAGLYFIKSAQINSQTVAVDSTSDEQDQKSEESSNQSSTNDDDKTPAKKDEQTNEKTGDTDKKDSQSSQSTQSVDSSDTSNKNDKTTDAEDSSNKSDSAALPKTGPGDTSMQLIGVTALAASVAAYVQSRRSL